MLNFLSAKSITPITSSEKTFLKELHLNPIFILALIVKITLILYIYPSTHLAWFIPFIKSSLDKLSLDPWLSYLNNGGTLEAFPYGITMLAAYVPLSTAGKFLDDYFGSSFFIFFGFKLTTLIFDYLVLISLAVLARNCSRTLLLIAYWSSPLAIYITYVHGQLDIVPISLLMMCLCMINWNRFKSGAIFLALAVSSKLSMLLALPLILIFIQKRRGFGQEIFYFILFLILSLVFLIFPFSFSSGYVQMVLGTKTIERLYTVYIPYGNQLKVYIIPVMYIISLYLVWRLKRITKDLFIISTGICFFSLLIFIPPGPGWLLWIIPFLSFYQIKSKKDIFSLGLLFSSISVLNNILISSGAQIFLPLENINLNLYSNFNSFKEISYNNILFTAQQGLLLLIAIRMFIYGLKRNNYYKNSDEPLVIAIDGENYKISYLLSNSLSKLFGTNSMSVSLASFYSNKYENSYLSKSLKKISKIKRKSLAEKNILYRSNFNRYSKKNIFSISWKNYIPFIRSYFFNRRSDYILLLNDLNLDFLPLSLENRVDIKVVINNFINVDKLINNSYECNRNTINFFIKKKFELETFQNQSIELSNEKLVVFLPIGFLHDQLLRYCISISAIKVDAQISKDENWVIILFEGELSNDDISEIAKNIIPKIDDFSLKENSFESGVVGLMQIVILAYISESLESSRNSNSPLYSFS